MNNMQVIQQNPYVQKALSENYIIIINKYPKECWRCHCKLSKGTYVLYGGSGTWIMCAADCLLELKKECDQLRLKEALAVED
jgi:hypothetical protein